MLEDVLRYLEEKRSCPHCGQTLSLCHAPSIHVGDGLGWGSEYLFICLNDECPMFAGAGISLPSSMAMWVPIGIWNFPAPGRIMP